MDNNCDIILDQLEYDIVIFGTGLVETVLAGSLAKQGQKILILDLERSYSSNIKTVNLKELVQTCNANQQPLINNLNSFLQKKSIYKQFYQHSNFIDINHPEKFELNLYKYYNVDMCPRLIPSTSLTAEVMKQADLDLYMQFKAVQGIYYFDNDLQIFVTIPTSKGEIFTHSKLSILEKRMMFKIMQTLMGIYHTIQKIRINQNSTQEFDKDLQIDEQYFKLYEQFKDQNCYEFLKNAFKGCSEKIFNVFLYTLANYEYNIQIINQHQQQFSQRFLQQFSTYNMIFRIYEFIKSLGVHTSQPYLYTNYGTGDIPQGYVRIAAVFGSIFILNDKIKIFKIEQDKEIKQSTDIINAEEKYLKIYTNLAGPNTDQKENMLNCNNQENQNEAKQQISNNHLSYKFLRCKKIICGMEYKQSLQDVLNQNIKIKIQIEEKFNLFRAMFIFDLQNCEENILDELITNPKIYIIPPNNKLIQNSNPVIFFILDKNTYTTPSNKFIIFAKMTQDLVNTNITGDLQQTAKEDEISQQIQQKQELLKWKQKVLEFCIQQFLPQESIQNLEFLSNNNNDQQQNKKVEENQFNNDNELEKIKSKNEHQQESQQYQEQQEKIQYDNNNQKNQDDEVKQSNTQQKQEQEQLKKNKIELYYENCFIQECCVFNNNNNAEQQLNLNQQQQHFQDQNDHIYFVEDDQFDLNLNNSFEDFVTLYQKITKIKIEQLKNESEGSLNYNFFETQQKQTANCKNSENENNEDRQSDNQNDELNQIQKGQDKEVSPNNNEDDMETSELHNILAALENQKISFQQQQELDQLQVQKLEEIDQKIENSIKQQQPNIEEVLQNTESQQQENLSNILQKKQES